MDIRRLDLNLLVVLDALLDEGSVTRAAQRLALSQPAVSAALGRLRDMFEDPLFTRAQRGIVPTARATALAEPLKRILRDADEIVRPPVFDPATAQRELRIATSDYMLVTLGVPLLEHFCRHAPGLRLSVRSLELSDIPARLARGDLDFGITAPEFAAPDLRSRFLYTDHYLGAARRRHPILAGDVTIDSLCAWPHTLVVPAGGAARGPADDALAALGAARRVALVLPSFLALPYALRETDLVAIAPARLLAQMKRDLAVFDLPIAMPRIDVIAVWHPRSHNDPAHRWVRERLAALAGRP